MRAVFSDDRRYRYALWREVSGLFNEGCVLFVMLNPSTADATVDDPTIRRCIGFAESWGYGRLAVANLYAWRATDPAELHPTEDPVGPLNDHWIAELAGDAERVVAAWGADVGPIADRGEVVLQKLLREGPVDALALTAHGQPRHPLYVKADVEPVDYGQAVTL